MQHSSREFEKELQQLAEFSASSLRSGSVVSTAVSELIVKLQNAQYSVDRGNHRCSQPSARRTALWTLHMRYRASNSSHQATAGFASASSTGEGVSFTVSLGPDASTHELKVAVESKLGRGFVLGALTTQRTGVVLSSFDRKTSLAACGLQDAVELVVVRGETQSSAESSGAGKASAYSVSSNIPTSPTTTGNTTAGLARLYASNVLPANHLQLLEMAIHAFVLDAGFLCVTEQKSAVPGFAAPVRELPKDTFLPGDWHADDDEAIALQYKLKSKPGKQFLLTSTTLGGDQLLVTFSQKNGESSHFDVAAQDFLDSNAVTQSLSDGAAFVAAVESGIRNSEVLEEKVRTALHHVVPSLRPARLQTPSAADPQQQEQQQPLSVEPLPSTAAPPPASNVLRNLQQPRNPAAVNIGDRDLNPQFPQAVDPGFFGAGAGVGGDDGRGDFYYPPGGVPSPGYDGGGSLVGPNHPMFAPPSGGGYGGEDGGPAFFGDGGGGYYPQMPQPRFDPFGPVPGPHGPNFGNPGVDGRGRMDPRGGRGGRGGRGAPTGGSFPGEPNPDHLRPPGW